MADFGLAAQIGRGGGGGGMSQQQDPQNRMLQMMQLQQLQQNMMLARDQEARAAGLYGTQLGTLQEQLNNLRNTEKRAAELFGPEFERKKYEASTAGSQSTLAKVGSDIAQEGYNVKTRMLKLRSTTEPDVMMLPEFQKNLMSKDPELAIELGRLVTEGQKKNSEIQKAGYDATTARMAQQKAIVGSIANSLGGVVDQQTFTTVLNELEKVDPLATKLIGPRFTAEAMIKLERRMRGLQNYELKEDAKGNFVRIDTDTNTSAIVGSRVLPDVKLNPEGDAATYDAARTLGAAPPPGAVPGAPYTPPGMGPKAVAAGELTTAQETAKAAVKEKALQPQIDAAIKELTAAAAPGGLISKSTGSGLGRQVDRAAGMVGIATEGARAGARLAPIADLALKIVPRFEGPQGVMDVQSYKDAAGALADTSLPVKIRQDAAKEVVRLLKERRGQFTLPGAEPEPGESTARAPAVGAVDQGYRFKGGDPADKANWEKQ